MKIHTPDAGDNLEFHFVTRSQQDQVRISWLLKIVLVKVATRASRDIALKR